jgi:hypothetical protein
MVIPIQLPSLVCLAKCDIGTCQNDLILANHIQAIEYEEGSHIIVLPSVKLGLDVFLQANWVSSKCCK